MGGPFLRIAIVGPFFWPQLEGVEKVMLMHARHLARRGHEVHVISSRLQFPRGEFTDIPATEEMDGFRVHRLEVLVRSPGWRFFYLNNGGLVIRGLGATLRRIAPDVLHAHQIAAPSWAHGAAWHALTRRRRFFYSPHFHPDAVKERWFHNAVLHGLNRLPVATARRIFHLTSLDYDPFLAEYPFARPERCAVLPNGVDPPRAAQQHPSSGDGGALRLLFVGRVDDRRKGFDVLRAAFARIRRPGWTLTVVGRVSEETRASLMNEFGPEAVRVLGPVDENALERAYAEAEVFVMPSRYEGFGMPYIEAMRYGVAVVGTATGGVPEVVPPGTGLLVPPEDVSGLAEALERLGASAAERARLGEAGRAWSERFHWDAIVGRLEAEYAEA